MFEVGFQELFLLGVIALLVVGPERLPGLARTVGVWVGKAQRLVGQVRADVERELRADELRRSVKEFSSAGVLTDMRKEVEEFASDVSGPVTAAEVPAKGGGGTADADSVAPAESGLTGAGPAGDARSPDPAAAGAAGTAGSEPVPRSPQPHPGGGAAADVEASDPAGAADAGPTGSLSMASMSAAAAASVSVGSVEAGGTAGSEAPAAPCRPEATGTAPDGPNGVGGAGEVRRAEAGSAGSVASIDSSAADAAGVEPVSAPAGAVPGSGPQTPEFSPLERDERSAVS